MNSFVFKLLTRYWWQSKNSKAISTLFIQQLFVCVMIITAPKRCSMPVDLKSCFHHDCWKDKPGLIDLVKRFQHLHLSVIPSAERQYVSCDYPHSGSPLTGFNKPLKDTCWLHFLAPLLCRLTVRQCSLTCT